MDHHVTLHDADSENDRLSTTSDSSEFTSHSSPVFEKTFPRLPGRLSFLSSSKLAATIPTADTTIATIGLSRRHKLLASWVLIVLTGLFLFRNLLPAGLITPAIDEIHASGLAARGHHIPSKIWQIMFTKPHTAPASPSGLSYDLQPDQVPYSHSWVARNPDFQYTLVGTEGANRFVRKHFAHDARVLDVHFGLRNHGPRSDIMRYLVMFVEGGVYSDTDVTCVKPIDQWIPERWRNQVRAVVGIEGDSFGGGLTPGQLWDVQFGQWTVAAVPGHRLFRRMIDSVVARLADLCEKKHTTIDKLEMTDIEIMNTTATALWSEVVFSELQRVDPSLKKPLDLSGMKEPRLYGDIMVLPIDGICAGVGHSGATVGRVPEMAIVMHHFHGSWRAADGIEGVDSKSDEEKEEEP